MPEKPPKRRVRATGGRITPKGTRPDGYVPDTVSHTGQDTMKPSPRWVPILMFGLLGGGIATILVNYTASFWETSNIVLLAGLAAILAGIITATQYR